MPGTQANNLASIFSTMRNQAWKDKEPIKTFLDNQHESKTSEGLYKDVKKLGIDVHANDFFIGNLLSRKSLYYTVDDYSNHNQSKRVDFLDKLKAPLIHQAQRIKGLIKSAQAIGIHIPHCDNDTVLGSVKVYFNQQADNMIYGYTKGLERFCAFFDKVTHQLTKALFISENPREEEVEISLDQNEAITEIKNFYGSREVQARVDRN